MIGVVLCGGESKRMGSDKGLLPVGSVTWAQHAEAKLAELDIPVVISINQAQLPNYNHLYGAEKLIIDTVNVKGPLKGLLSVHQYFPDDDLMLLACDMTDMDVDTLQQLKQHYHTNPTFDYYLYECEGFMEPLCAVYPTNSLRNLCKAVNSSELTHFSMHKFIRDSNYKTIQIKDKTKFSNYNTANHLRAQINS
ncbi:molybdenum cofactor guanylyltransferase [Pedobacter foliorum]|uniref:molybdenum cofactor guanylyltransferase n=1 Tax=Pedobacter foliorum TaxID=2739058 RepID=UPI00156375EC|nr:molybdenum cofactor guanylyltransferase [Pedobacter foliorum]NRF41518.1 molybdenum cofactor guanylyltransferase [Pedobacter foliorum]